MPIRQANFGYEDQPYDRRLHKSNTKGGRGECTGNHCPAPPVTSRHWENDAYEDGWWGAYCQRHTQVFAVGA